MKNLVISICILFIATHTAAQVMVNKIYNSNNASKFEHSLVEGDYEKLKKATVYFILPESLIKEKEDFQTALAQAWKYSDIMVIGLNEIQEYYSKKNTAFFMITYGYSNINGVRYVDYINMELIMARDVSKKMEDKNKIRYASFDLVQDCKTLLKMREQWNAYDLEKQMSEFENYLFNKANFNNFKPSIVANYMKIINTHLKNKEDNNGSPDLEKLSSLSRDTLYLTKNFLEYYENYEKKTDRCELFRLEKDQLMSDYLYEYKFISFEELDEKISNGDQFYYAIMGNRLTFTVYYSSSGEVVAKGDHDAWSKKNHFISKDIKKLVGLIAKASSKK